MGIETKYFMNIIYLPFIVVIFYHIAFFKIANQLNVRIF